MVLTSVACVRHVAEGQVRCVPLLTHVRFRFEVDFASITLETSVVEKDQRASMLACAAMWGASSAWRPVKMLATPAGRSEVSST